jgi:small subunit ribosomal protein S20
MAITKSAKKAIRQSVTRNERNVVYKDNIKILVKKAKALVSKNQNDEAKKILPDIYKALDKAAKVGVIKKNNADRRKSRLTKLIDLPAQAGKKNPA